MWDKTKWATISAVLGVLLGKFADGVSAGNLPNLVPLVIMGIVLTTTIASIGPIRYIFSRSYKYDLNGEWDSEWKYSKGNDIVTVSETLRINQYGRYIIGTAESHLIKGPYPFKKLSYKLSGTICAGGYIDGEWSSTDKGRKYYGHLQGYISPGSHKVQVKWIGIESGGVHGGSCIWNKKV